MRPHIHGKLAEVTAAPGSSLRACLCLLALLGCSPAARVPTTHSEDRRSGAGAAGAAETDGGAWSASQASAPAIAAGTPEPGDAGGVRDAAAGVTIGQAPQPAPQSEGKGPPALRFSKVAAGYTHACAISSEGVLYCWGDNGFGQLGLGDTDARASAARVGSQSDWSAVSVGRFHSCGIRAGQLYCWGSNSFGQSAGPDAAPLLAPTAVDAPAVGWSAVGAGDWHTCALDDGGHAYCFGYDLLGRLGNGQGLGDSNDPGEGSSTPVAVVGGASYLALDAGAAHTCAVRSDGTLWCWGADDRGQLGAAASDACTLNTASAACSLLPVQVQVAGDPHFAAVSAGTSHSCAITDEQVLWCFGANDFGQLGTGDTQPTTAPQIVAGEFTLVSAGATHTCALRSDGRLACFGNDESAQLGVPGLVLASPTDVAPDPGFRDVSAGTLASCAVDPLGAGLCWGQGPFAGSPTPSEIVPM